MPGFFMPVNQDLAGKSRNRLILIPVYPFTFNDLGLTEPFFVARLRALRT